MPALLTQQKADLPTEVEKSACFCARPAYGECARCNGPGRCNSPDSRHGAIMLPVRILPSHRSQFCNGGVSSLRRMPLQIRSCAHSAGRAGFVPISFAPLPDPQKGLRQAATPDQQAIFIFHFIIGIQGNKVNPRSGLDIPSFVWDFYFRGPFRLSDSFQLLCGISVFTLDFG